MRGKGPIEFGGITDDFSDISLTNIITIIKKKEKETNEYRTYKIRKGPICYVPFISCLHVQGYYKRNRHFQFCIETKLLMI
jgi:hypothetical protein